MTDLVQFALLGLGAGAVYALLAVGLIFVYRGSGVINFGQGAIAMISAFVFWELHTVHHVGSAPSLVVACAGSMVIGLATYGLFVRWMIGASALSKAVVTIGLLLTLVAIANLIWSPNLQSVPSLLPLTLLHLGPFVVGEDQLLLLAIALVVTGAAWWGYRRTLFGLALSAVAENRRGTAALGWSPHVLGLATWGIAGLLGGLAGVLVAPLSGLQATTTSFLVLPALAAALVGRLSSFSAAAGGAILVGVAQSELAEYVHLQGVSDAAPLVAIIIFLIVKGRAIPGRDELQGYLPSIGTGRVRPVVAVAATAVVGILIFQVFNSTTLTALTTSIVFSIVIMSLVVLTGYAGQLSLAPLALGGIGAFVAGQLYATQGWPFLAAVVAGLIIAIPAGIVIGLPALRIRGLQLAVVTLGVSTAIYDMLFTSGHFGSGTVVAGFTLQGTNLPGPSLLGLNVTAADHPARYAALCMVALVLATAAIANLRRGRVGRRLIAVRENERAASALGISPTAGKLYAFTLSSVIAALGGILLAFSNSTILYSSYDPVTGLLLVAYALIGGVGFLLGPLYAGSVFVVGGIVFYLLSGPISSLTNIIPLAGGVILMVVATVHPDGVASLLPELGQRVGRRWHRTIAAGASLPASSREHGRVVPAPLEVRDLSVRYGGVVALNAVSIDVAPGEVVGLIGPNGAGKTTFIDAVSGFVPHADGTVLLAGKPVQGMSAHRRARAGMARSFQALELFEDLTVMENLRTASDDRDALGYVTNLIWPGNGVPASATLAAVEEFGLGEHLATVARDLPYGQRRLVAVARAVACEPSVLLLDEPAAGLDETESAELARCVRRLAAEWGIGVLLVEHDMAFVMGLCDRVVVLDFGRLLAEGTTTEIRRDPAVRQAYLGAGNENVRPDPLAAQPPLIGETM